MNMTTNEYLNHLAKSVDLARFHWDAVAKDWMVLSHRVNNPLTPMYNAMHNDYKDKNKFYMSEATRLFNSQTPIEPKAQ